MTNTAKALYRFFSGFGLDAYVEYSIPDDAQLPYISYQLIEPDWDDGGTFYARVWYRSTSFVEINAKVDEIRAAVGECISIPTQGGAVYLSKGSPWAQHMPMEGDDTLKVMYLNFNIMAHVADIVEPDPPVPEPIPPTPDPSNPETLYPGQTVDADGWIVNSNGRESVYALIYENDPRYQGQEFELRAKVNDHIEYMFVLFIPYPGPLPIPAVYPITQGPGTYVDGMTNVVLSFTVPSTATGCEISTAYGGYGIKDIVLTRVQN